VVEIRVRDRDRAPGVEQDDLPGCSDGREDEREEQDEGQNECHPQSDGGGPPARVSDAEGPGRWWRGGSERLAPGPTMACAGRAGASTCDARGGRHFAKMIPHDGQSAASSGASVEQRGRVITAP
jgi:hypothetical protein